MTRHSSNTNALIGEPSLASMSLASDAESGLVNRLVAIQRSSPSG